ncbi:hypothetical protein M422DRAFT_169609 [Sphaerobolus stellatus SS14]|uniref:Core-binding (CB) domain-containing protein n=1 Tax=Sphaerobolus stellatus (strain SS14) TaxID=990650 RepID=A0A0C9VNN1_SPHS4|nr:hypothetical protein M422DRAFT_169609 [Sphaerobolus stellatus SS14]
MIRHPTGTRQPRTAWSLDRLKHERAVALGHALEASTSVTYTSQLQSYLSFCKMHGFSAEPTTDMLSFFVVYMAHHIKPSSVGCYLSGICNSLEPYYPDVRVARSAPIVRRTLAGMKKLRGSQPTHRKRALERDDLLMIISHLPSSPSHDELLFAAMLFTGFHGLLRLGELTIPDAVAKRTARKLTLRHTLTFEGNARFSFTLPFHKADRFYAGNMVMIQAVPHSPLDPLFHVRRYILSRDHSFPLLPALWLTSIGRPPSYS